MLEPSKLRFTPRVQVLQELDAKVRGDGRRGALLRPH